MLNSKQKGNITEIECMLAFLKLGYNVLTPYGDCERYDFVVDIQGRLLKIQVKTSSNTHINEGYIEFQCANKTTHNGKFVRHTYNKEQIDYFMTFYNEKAYLIPVEECSTRKRLRFTAPKNGQTKGITFAEEYELEKVVNKIINK
jgi:hypothetical protein